MHAGDVRARATARRTTSSLLLDREARCCDLDAAMVRCALRPAGRHRRRRDPAGRAGRAHPTAGPATRRWFMDYRNADGSVAEMCGNGVRVFVRYLLDEGLADRADGAGRRPGPGCGRPTVLPTAGSGSAMGPAAVPARRRSRGATAGRRASSPRCRVDVGNPHAVSFVRRPGRARPARRAPPGSRATAFPHGVNVEFVAGSAPRHIAMRVYERGVGGDPVLRHRHGAPRPRPWHAARSAERSTALGERPYRVDVPGGTVEVELGRGRRSSPDRPCRGPRRAAGALVAAPARSGRAERRQPAPSGITARRLLRRTCDSCPTMSLPESEYLSASAPDTDESVATDASDEPPRPRRRAVRRRRLRRSSSYDLAERQSLRRVAGMSTELTDITEVEYRQLLLERVVLVSVWTTGSEVDAENAMAELKLLAETAGSEVLEGAGPAPRSAPTRPPTSARGKVEELRDVVVATGADTVICDGELAPAPAAQPGGPGQGQGHRPDRADPRHLRPARQERGGQGSGRAGPAAVPQAAAARLGRQPLPPGRWPGQRRCRHRWPRARRDEARDRPSPDQQPDREAARDARASMDSTRRDQAGRAAPPRGARRSRSSATPTPASPACSTGSPAPGCWSRTRCSPRSTRPPGAPQTTDGRVYTLTDTVGFVRHLPHDLVEAFALDAGGVGAGRPAGARGRRVGSRPGRSDQGRARRAGRHRGRRRARADRAQQGRPGRVPRRSPPCAPRLPGRRRRLGPHRRRASTSCAALVEARLPRPEVEVRALIPYERGDLVNRIHQAASCSASEHTEHGTLVAARVHPDLAGELARSSSQSARPPIADASAAR